MAEDTITYSVSHLTVVALVFFLAALLTLLFFMYKYLNREARGKYTVQRIVFREGGLRDRARGVAVSLGNRLGVQLWPQSDPADEDGEEGDEEEEAHSNEDDSTDEEDAVMLVNEKRTDSMAEVNDAKGSSGADSEDSSDEDAQANSRFESEVEPESAKGEEAATSDDVQTKSAGETSAPIVINLSQFSGSVLWSEEDKSEGGDVTAL